MKEFCFFDYEKEIIEQITKDEPCDPCEYEESGAKNISTYSGVWWIGGISLAASYECTIKCKTKDGKIKDYDCKFTYEMNDAFEDPTDFNNAPGGEWYDFDGLEFGRVFSVTHTWKRNAKGTR